MARILLIIIENKIASTEISFDKNLTIYYYSFSIMDKYSFQIIPPHAGKIRQLRLEGKHLRNFLIGFGIFVLLNFAALFFNLYSTFNSGAAFTKAEKSLFTEINNANNRADLLASALDDLTKKNNILCDMADIEPIDASKLSYGIGGPELSNINPKDPLAILKAKNLDRKLDSLIVAARTENESIDKAKGIFEQKKTLFAQTPSIWPMNGYISSGFGKREDPFTGLWKLHEGVDICGRKGTPIKASADGRIEYAGWYFGYGNIVRINHSYYKTVYAHLSETKVLPGQWVKRGEIIGTCGNSGSTTGVHLHYEVHAGGRALDPQKYLYPNVVMD